MESRFTFEFRSFVFEIKQTTVFMWLNDKNEHRGMTMTIHDPRYSDVIIIGGARPALASHATVRSEG